MKGKTKKTVIKVLVLFLILSSFANIWPVSAANMLEGVQEEVPGASIEPEPSEENPEEEKTESVYRVTFLFDSNGGKGSMGDLLVESQSKSELAPNAFKKAGCKFTGWNTKADGSGEEYKDQADVSSDASESNDGKKITLYAQWKLNKPAIQNVKSMSPEQIKVSCKKSSGTSGYEIQYSVNKSFKNALTKKTKSVSASLPDVIPGKKYYVRMRGYYKYKGMENYSDWSKVLSVTVKKGSTIMNTKSQAAIETDVRLSGSGSGYHAKLVMCTPTSAVSYGIQYDAHAAAPYTGKAMAMIENVSSNGAGGQQYSRPGNKSLQLGKKYHLMMTVDQSGHGKVYLDYKKIGSFYQPNLSGEIALRIEASARLNGDKVNASFSNVKCKWNGNYDSLRRLEWTEFRQNSGLKYTNKNNSFKLSGTVKGIAGDWDSDYNSVSEILQFH